MPPKPLTESFAVSAQITAEEIPALAAQGFTHIVNNRPDGEEPRQPRAAEIKAAAAAAGMTYAQAPIVGMPTDEADIAAMKAAIAAGGAGKTLAFCRSGTRSTVLWALAQAGTAPTAEMVAAAARQGYDISGLAPHIEARAARG